jgi:hypothetical protein
MHVVKIACERPDDAGRSLSQWDCTEIARQPARDGVVPSISAATVRQVLLHRRPKPWRQKMWPPPKVPRDAAVAARVQGTCDLDTRPLGPGEAVLCADEMTGLQPRPRESKTLATRRGQPTRVGHEYGRCGALDLLAAFDARTGKVSAMTARKRRTGLIALLGQLDRETPAPVGAIHIALDNVRMHKGEQVQAWLAKHPRFVFHHPPVHWSRVDQVEQWSGIVERERLRIADLADKGRLAERLMAFVREWSEIAHPANWTSKSVAKVMATCQIEGAKPLSEAA